jgi:hypothetical protein
VLATGAPGVPHHQDHHGCCDQDDDHSKHHMSDVWHAGAACKTAAGQLDSWRHMQSQQAMYTAAMQRPSWWQTHCHAAQTHVAEIALQGCCPAHSCCWVVCSAMPANCARQHAQTHFVR